MGYQSRRQVRIENERLRLTFLPGGGHVAAIELVETGSNPLWDPPWETIDPSSYDAARHSRYGVGTEAALLSGIVGHNLCFDLFGVPSNEEAATGLGVHGEASSLDWSVESAGAALSARLFMPLAGFDFERRIALVPGSNAVEFVETATNLAGTDRPVGWTQHVTLGPPFLERGKVRFASSATRSKVFEGEFAPGADRFVAGAEFDWPRVPLARGGTGDLRELPDDPVSGGYTAHRMDPDAGDAFFSAYRPDPGVLFGCLWNREDFPWLGIWEENRSRSHAPWNGQTLARGMEFGVSPFPETRREAVCRGPLFGAPTIRWIPARSAVTVRYHAVLLPVGRADFDRIGDPGLPELLRSACT